MSSLMMQIRTRAFYNCLNVIPYTLKANSTYSSIFVSWLKAKIRVCSLFILIHMESQASVASVVLWRFSDITERLALTVVKFEFRESIAREHSRMELILIESASSDVSLKLLVSVMVDSAADMSEIVDAASRQRRLSQFAGTSRQYCNGDDVCSAFSHPGYHRVEITICSTDASCCTTKICIFFSG